ncbi:hypothetical protein ASPWEDRAFT_25158 [Aspergillus wentii DTO 134E9]|uniref:Gfo/Idh/MocA-like oxidoreductase N-terminal domain-containing protein n=1 Tax=Aspergillus wentii DTO 134E9 TaxID=1073089 RepID=A0A1L9RWS8_ASPWE|nr:uncharacterized protein ASPWEDRAFT_25158 [Aspergillus wentii DTO 134E9]KAI9928995.1 hypothetical protein MW887_001388 [Aspergillus wentii]OJJ39317.1 hypothetical protein ASPWEDRAFT_25158 [Aspergillus wentii DTO 134E9]
MKEPQLPTNGSPPSDNIPLAINPSKQLRFLVIGAGSRGNAYARAVTTATPGVIHAVAEPHAFKRREFGRSYIWGTKEAPIEGQEFADWRDWLQWEVKRRQKTGDACSSPGVDGVFICTLDETHVEIVQAIASLNLHILCEKPLALSLTDCLSVYRALSHESPSTIFSIGHVLRYSPHNTVLRKFLLSDQVIGDIVSLEHCEPVGWWHFSHSYVRGNWRRATPAGDGSLLTKSCHDIDFILWLLSSPPSPSPNSTYHHPRTISSTGSLTQFNRKRKPRSAGHATNCLSCPAEQECNYSALKIYRDMHLSQSKTAWPVSIVCPDIEDVHRSLGPEAADQHLLSRLGEDYDQAQMDNAHIAARPWYGRCVYEADNTVCDDQIVTITWDDESPDPDSPTDAEETTESGPAKIAKTAVFHMIAPTEKQCERRGRVYGTRGEISYDSRSISVYRFDTRETTVVDVPRQPPEEKESHGGGDYGLARSFVSAVEAVENKGWDVREAQARFVGCTLEEAVRSHAVVFAAEEARREEKVVKWKDWWEEKLSAAAVQRLE